MTYLTDSIIKLLDDDCNLNSAKYINTMFQTWSSDEIERFFGQLVGVTFAEIDSHLPDEYDNDKYAYFVFEFSLNDEVVYLKISAYMESYEDLSCIEYKIVNKIPKTIFVYE